MTRPGLHAFVHEVGAVVRHADEAELARAVADRLPRLLAAPDLLDAAQRRPSPEGYRQHLLHVDAGGRFSVVALVWGAGQSTPIHDHVAWCVVGVYEGEELETGYRAVPAPGGEPRLIEVAAVRRRRGEVTWLVPAGGDIHRVENPTAGTAVSIHVYGADIARVGTSIRRRYPEGAVSGRREA